MGLRALLVLSLVACSSTPPPEPPELRNITVTPLERSRTYGGRAFYTVDAPLEVVRDVILDFDSQAEFRPMVEESKQVSRSENGGEVNFKFRGMVGYQPEADCVYSYEEDERSFRLTFKMTSPGFALWSLDGGFALTRQAGGRKTFVRQEFLVSAIVINHEELLRDLKIDAAAIRDRCVMIATGKQ
jgi:hypothetical protein